MAKKANLEGTLQFAVINPCCAAIDVGSMMMMISYSDVQGKQHLLKWMLLQKACISCRNIKAGGCNTCSYGGNRSLLDRCL